MAAIGCSFGALCVLHLARHNSHLRAIGSFHGVLTALASELTARGADWQLHAYGHAMLAFMAAFVDDPECGIQYDEATARRAWACLVELLAETFDRTKLTVGAVR